MVDTNDSFLKLNKTTVLNDDQEVVLPEYLPKESNRSRNTVQLPKNDHVVTPIIGDIKPQGLNNTSSIDKASITEAIATGFAPTAKAWGAGFRESLEFSTDKDYTEEQRNEVVQDFIDTYGTPSEKELELLTVGIKSYAHHQHRIERITDHRADEAILASRPYWSTAASLLDIDAVAAVVPVAGEGVLAAKIGVGATRAAKAVTMGAGAGLINESIADSDFRSSEERAFDIIGFTLAGALSSIPKTGTKLDDAIAKEIEVIRTGKLESSGFTGDARNVFPNPDTLHGKDLISEGLKSKSGVVGKVANGADDFIKSSSANLSSGERMFQYVDYDMSHPATKLLASARTQGDNAIYTAATVQANLDHRLMSLSDQISAVTREVYGTNRFFWGKHAKNMQLVQLDFIKHTQQLDSQVLKFKDTYGRLPDEKDFNKFINDSNAPTHIKELQHTYVKSGFAEEAFDLINHAGLLDAEAMEKLSRRSTYIPVRHSYARMRDLLKSGAVKEDALFKFLGTQIQRMYPEMQNRLGSKALSAHTLGKSFFNTQKSLATDLSQIKAGGFTKDNIIDMLVKAGIEKERALKTADNIFSSKTGKKIDGGSHKNLKERLNWNWDATFKGTDGTKYSMADLVDTDIVKNLQDYSRSMSHRIGLAHYGVKGTSDLDNLLAKMLEERPDKIPLADAKRFLQGVRSQLLGQPIGEELTPLLRSATTVGGSMVLSGSGIWAINEMVSQIAKVGLMRSLPNMIKALKPALSGLKGATKTDMESLEAIIIGRVGGTGAWQHVVTRTADNFEIGADIHATIAHHGQSTRFWNGSEAVRRYQVGMMAGIVEDAIKGASKGNAKDIKYLRETLKFNDELIESVRTEYSKHGGKLDKWDVDVQLDTMQRVQYEIENLAMNIRAGENPAFMEQSSIGKILFPFMSYGFAMQEKMLRNSFQRGGALAVGFMFAVQFPMALLLGAINNIKNGKPVTDDPKDLIAAGINAYSILGAASYPISLALSGMGSGSAAAMIPVDSAMRLGAKIVNPDSEVTARDIARMTPLYSATIIPLLISATEENK